MEKYLCGWGPAPALGQPIRRPTLTNGSGGQLERRRTRHVRKNRCGRYAALQSVAFVSRLAREIHGGDAVTAARFMCTAEH